MDLEKELVQAYEAKINQITKANDELKLNIEGHNADIVRALNHERD